jgi:hypothetical protein
MAENMTTLSNQLSDGGLTDGCRNTVLRTRHFRGCSQPQSSIAMTSRSSTGRFADLDRERGNAVAIATPAGFKSGVEGIMLRLVALSLSRSAGIGASIDDS